MQTRSRTKTSSIFTIMSQLIRTDDQSIYIDIYKAEDTKQEKQKLFSFDHFYKLTTIVTKLNIHLYCLQNALKIIPADNDSTHVYYFHSYKLQPIF